MNNTVRQKMKLVSPLSLEECRAVLREQVGRRGAFTRLRLFRSPTSHVIGEVSEEEVVLESSIDLFSKRFIGALRSAPEGSVLQGRWEYPFGSRFWGNERFDEEEIFGFLSEYAHFEKPA